MKKPLILIIILLSILLGGCAQAKIHYEIDDSYNVIVNYRLVIDRDAIASEQLGSLQKIISLTSNQYENNGFVINEYDIGGDQLILDMTLTKANSNYDEAYQTLKEVMSDPNISFLLEVSETHEVLDYENTLDLGFSTDLSAIIAASGIVKLSSATQDEIYTNLNNSALTIEVVLPYSTVVEQSDNITVSSDAQHTTLSVPILIDQATTFNAVTRMSTEDGHMIAYDISTSISKTASTAQTYHILMYVTGVGALVAAYFAIRCWHTGKKAK